MSRIKSIQIKTLQVLKKPYIAWLCIFFIFTLIMLLNIILMYGNKYSIEHIFTVLKNPSLSPSDSIYKGWTPGEAKDISEGLWCVFATIVGAAGLALAALVTQALSRNPLADASTLGMTQSGIFGIILALSFGFTAFYLKFIFSLIFGVTSVALLLLVITFTKGRGSSSKVILSGLAIGIIFKTITFLVRKGDKFLATKSYSYVLGGSESVNRVIGNNQWQILYIASGLIIAGLIIFAIVARGLTLIELGEDKAKALGVRVKTTKIVSLIVVALSVPSAIMLMGNVAFIGLFAVHLSRYLLKTRNYLLILIPSIVFSSTISMFGLLLTQYIPSVNSGLWMTFIGAPYLVYAGLRGLK